MANRYPRIKIDRRAQAIEVYGPVYRCTQCTLSYHSFEQRTVCIECVEKNEAGQESDEAFVTNMTAALKIIGRGCFKDEALARYDALKEEQEPLVYDAGVGYITRKDAGLPAITPEQHLAHLADLVLRYTEIKRAHNGRGRNKTYAADIDGIVGAARQLAETVQAFVEGQLHPIEQQSDENPF